jgi:CDP-paratose 2-epimerase
MKLRLLITGICGFVGSTLARGLREGWPDWEIVGLDNLVRAGSETNRRALAQHGIKFFHGDVRNPSDLETLPACNWIIEAAANPSVLAGVDGKTSSRQLIEHNLIGTINLLELAKQWRSGFTLLSTSRVYSIRALAAIPVETRGDRFVPQLGAPAEVPATQPPRQPPPAADGTRHAPRTTHYASPLTPQGVTEDFPTSPPLSLYGTSKRASELLACEYAESFDLPVAVLRCGVLAGAGQFGRIDQGIFSYWIHSWRAKRPLKYIGFNGTGCQVRDCLHARDLLPLIAAQIGKPRSDAPSVLNVSGGLDHSASLRQLSDWCAQRFGPHEVAAEAKNRPFDVPWLVLDSARAAQVWGWKPQTSLKAIWTEIAQHAEQNPDWLETTA